MKALCTQCNQETNHEVLQQIVKKFFENEEGYWANGTWEIIQCKGCESISFREVWETSEDFDPEDGSPILSVKLYPIRGKGVLPIKNYYNTPPKVRSIYRETIDAFNSDLLALCAGGLRAVIEGICLMEGILAGPVTITKPDGSSVTIRRKDLQGKISGLHENGLLTKKHAEILHEHRYLGNEALHTLDKPTKQELKLAIEIVEHTIDNLYELTEKAEDLRFQQSKRKKPK